MTLEELEAMRIENEERLRQLEDQYINRKVNG